MSIKAKAIYLATFAAGVGVTLLSTINDSDVHAYHATRPHSEFVNVEPGAFFEVNQRSIRVCHFAGYSENFDPTPERYSRRYYNILGTAVPVLPVAYRYASGLGSETASAPVELNLNFYEQTLRSGFYGDPDENCYERIRVASERGSVICVVDAVYRYADSNQPFAVKFKEFTFSPAQGAQGIYPRCPLASNPSTIAAIKRSLIAFSELLPDAEDLLPDTDNLLGETTGPDPKV